MLDRRTQFYMDQYNYGIRIVSPYVFASISTQRTYSLLLPPRGKLNYDLS